MGTSVMWFGDDGILYSVTKPGQNKPFNRDEAERQMHKFREAVGNRKVCMILETNSSAPPPSKADRDWVAKELDSVTKAMAIIATSPLSRMVANLFFGLKPPAYPARFFATAEEARNWIKHYL